MTASAVWPDGEGGVTSSVPPVVETGRVVFESETGESCCVELDPGTIWGGDPAEIERIRNQGVVSSAELGDVLTNDPSTEEPGDPTDVEFVPGPLPGLVDLPPGLATVTLSAFAGNFAPAVAGIVDTCSTVPESAGRPCDPVRVASAAFESAPTLVSITPGSRTNLGEVPMIALPFVLEFSPPQGSANASPVDFAFTIVDAITGIRADSVDLALLHDSNPAVGVPVPIELTACSDGTATPCSSGRDLDLVGFKATGRADSPPAGPALARITGSNLADPVRSVDFRYGFVVSPGAAGAGDESAGGE